jgi:hypothetical protein
MSTTIKLIEDIAFVKKQTRNIAEYSKRLVNILDIAMIFLEHELNRKNIKK